MYKSFYNFDKKPFQISSDPSFIWLSEHHEEALATLKYGVLDNKGFLLLTGDVGTGKTTLINSLISGLNDQVIYASVPDPRLEKLDFLNYIAESFGINEEFTSKGKFVKAFSRLLRKAYEQEKSVLLIIDEAQMLTQDLLEEVRLLSNINIENSTILSIFFVGQNEFNEVITRPENRAVCHRITLNYNLLPLDLEQTSEYINHRLKIAGATEEIFTSSAIRAIYDYSDGLPRRINIICDHCLITGYASGKKVINEKVVLNCISELSIPSYYGSVFYQNNEEPLASELYVPSKELFQSESKDEPGNDSLAEGNTHNDDSVKADIEPDQEQSYEKRAWLKWISILPLIVIVFIFLFQLLPESIIETFDSDISQEPSSTIEREVSKHESEGITAPPKIANTEELKSGEVEDASSSNSSIEDESVNLKIIQDETNTSIALTNARGNGEVEKQPTLQPDNVVSTTSIESSVENNIPQETLETKETLSLISYDEDSDYINHDSGEYLPTTSVSGSVNPPEKPEKYDSISEKEVHISPQPDQLLTIRFNSNSVHFKALDYELVKSYVDYLTSSPASTAIIAGYTDSSGSADYNYLISKYRAETVKSYFMGRGVSDSQLRIIAFGPRKPSAENDTEEGRELNRRVEVRILSGE